MKKTTFFIIIGMLSLSCASMPEKIDKYVDAIPKQKKFRTSIFEVETSYPIAFQAVINVFHDLNINILKKDYKNRIILGSLYPDVYGTHFFVSFTEISPQKTQITFKASGFKYRSDGNKFLVDKIKEEITLFELLRKWKEITKENKK